MREKEIERYLVTRVRGVGGRAYKWVSPGQRGVPDRLVVLPAARGRLYPVEIKAPGRKPTALQAAIHAELAAFGLPVHVIDSHEAVEQFIRWAMN